MATQADLFQADKQPAARAPLPSKLYEFEGRIFEIHTGGTEPQPIFVKWHRVPVVRTA